MPWKECSVVDERLQFVARRLAGEAMAELCREFGISRKTGYKIFDRLPAMRHGGAHGQKPTSVSLRQPTSVPGRKLHLERKARAPQLGCSQNPGALVAPVLRYSHPGEKYHPCGAGSLRLGGATWPSASPCAGNRVIVGSATQ